MLIRVCNYLLILLLDVLLAQIRSNLMLQVNIGRCKQVCRLILSSNRNVLIVSLLIVHNLSRANLVLGECNTCIQVLEGHLRLGSDFAL